MGLVWFGGFFERRLAKKFARDGWLSVAGYHVAPPHGDREEPRVWLTIAPDDHPRCLDGWSSLTDDDFLAIAALLGQPHTCWFNERTRALSTSPAPPVPEPDAPPEARDRVARFDASWTPGDGGRIRIRLSHGGDYAVGFQALEASRFAACLAAAAAPEVVFDPANRSIRVLPDGVTIAPLAPSLV